MKNRIKESNLNNIEDFENLDEGIVDTDYINNPVPSFPSLSLASNQEQMIEDEVKQAEEMSAPISYKEELDAQAEDLQKTINPVPKIEEKKSPQSEILNEYRRLTRKDVSDAQKYQTDMEQRAALLQGLGQMVQGAARFGRAEIGDNKVGADVVRRLGGLPQEQIKSELELGNEVEMNDPNSSISKFMRSQASKAFPGYEKEFASMTAKQLMQLPGLKTVSKTFQQSDYITTDTQEPLSFDPNLGKLRKLDGSIYEGPVSRNYSKSILDPSTQEYVNIDVMRGTQKGMITGPKLSPVIKREGSTQPEKSFEDTSYSNLSTKEKDTLNETMKDLNADPIFKKARESLSGAEAAEALLKSNAPGSAGAVARAILSTYESGGRFTDQDIEQFKGNPDLYSRLQRFLVKSFDPEKAFSEKDQKDLLKILTIAKQKNENILKNSYKPYIYNLGQKGFNPKFAERFLTGGFSQQFETDKVKIQAPSGQVREVSKENAEQYLKRPGYKKVD